MRSNESISNAPSVTLDRARYLHYYHFGIFALRVVRRLNYSTRGLIR